MQSETDKDAKKDKKAQYIQAQAIVRDPISTIGTFYRDPIDQAQT
jgi:hypothetical protein